MKSLVIDFFTGTAGFGASATTGATPLVTRSKAECTSLINAASSDAGTELLLT